METRICKRHIQTSQPGPPTKSYLHILASERVINPGHLQREGNWATDTNNICTEEQDATKNGTPNSQTGDTLGQGEAAEKKASKQRRSHTGKFGEYPSGAGQTQEDGQRSEYSVRNRNALKWIPIVPLDHALPLVSHSSDLQ
ncbi:uncharacterized protein LOC143269335 [Peromyscus maniculatus bairdii]|uniref:uncharacterized protein LOC143269335 n=1 Tax=Peromyscus maniculatus bairdii TaxID=230844 RepID=UPI003FD10DD2